MDFTLSEEQEMLRKSARDFLEKECPMSLVRDMENDEKGFSPDLWRRMAGLGWMGLALPEEYGGSGHSFLDLALILEEMGRALAPGPFISTVVLGALPILWSGAEAQRARFLPALARGDSMFTMAITDHSGHYSREAIPGPSTPTFMFVPDAAAADYIICAVRNGTEYVNDGGISLLILESGHPNVAITPLKTIGGDRQYEVVLTKTRFTAANTLGKIGCAWPTIERVIDHAAIAWCAYMSGAARRALDMTVTYVKERTQYGRPIGSFQAVQHKCADMAADVQACEYLSRQAAWRLAQGIPAHREVAIAKAFVSDAARRSCAQACYLHGGIGYSREYDAQLYLRRVTAATTMFGDAAFHRKTVAAALLD